MIFEQSLKQFAYGGIVVRDQDPNRHVSLPSRSLDTFACGETFMARRVWLGAGNHEAVMSLPTEVVTSLSSGMTAFTTRNNTADTRLRAWLRQLLDAKRESYLRLRPPWYSHSQNPYV